MTALMRLFDSRYGFALALALLLPVTALASWLGVRSGSPVLLAALNTAVACGAMFHFLWRRQPARAAAALLLWAYFLGACMTLWTFLMPEAAERAVFHGAAYREEMFRWIQSDEGPEGSPTQFLPKHAMHFSVFAALSFLSAGALGLLMGVLLLDYMAFYAGSLALHSSSCWAASLLAWNPWSLCRIAGFILWGVCLSSLSLDRLRGGAWRWQSPLPRMAAAGTTLLLLDVILKAALAPFWREMLHGLLP